MLFARKIFKSVAFTAFFCFFLCNLSAQSKLGTPRLMQGPMLGATLPNSIYIWSRVSGPFPVQIEYSETKDFKKAKKSDIISAEKSKDYIVKINLTNLKAETSYYYRVLVNGKLEKYLKDEFPFQFKTAPLSKTNSNFSIAFGSCARFLSDREQSIWNAVYKEHPDLFFWVGDNIYGDALDSDILREEYLRQRDVDALQSVIRNIPNLATWDDHDFGLNNHDKTNPIKKEALAVFKQVWANPSYGEDDNAGVYFKYSYSDVDFFFIDGRYHRGPNAKPDSSEKSLLGKRQYEWLTKNLAESKAIFKLIISGSGWASTKGIGSDSWSSFLTERNRLFDFITKNKVGGVVLLSGDTHVGELNAIPWSKNGGYDFYDLVGSPLAQSTGRNWMEGKREIRIRPVYFSGPNFGRVTFHLDTKSPYLEFTLINPRNEIVMKPLRLYAKELQNGISTWEKKQQK